jgi:ABC-type sugar transport system substrate-binding protein
MSQRTFRFGRKVAVALVATATIIALAGCNAISNGSTSSSNSPSKSLKSILFVSPLPNYSQWKLIGKCMGDEAKKKNVPFSIVGPSGSTTDANYMVSRIQQGIANGQGAIATFPLSAQQFDPLFAQAKTKHVLTASLFGGGSTKGQSTEIGTSYVTSAADAVKFISKNAGSSTVHVGVIVGAAVAPPKTWSDAFLAAAKKTSNVVVDQVGIDNSDATKDLDLAVNMLTAHPDITMFATNEGFASAGLDAAIKQTNNVGKVQFVGNGADASGVAALEDGTAASVLMQDLCGAGRNTTDALINIHAGKAVPAEIGVNIVYATKANYKKYLSGGSYL